MESYGSLAAPHDPPLPPPPPLSTLKVNQLDAVRLDNELAKILRQRFNSLFVLWRPFPEGHSEEIDALLRAILWAGTIWRDRPSPGNQFQNVQYANASYGGPPAHAPALARGIKVGYFMLYVVAPYALRKLRRILPPSWRDVCNRVESSLELLRWVNLMMFLFSGVYRSVEDRILKIRLVDINPLANRLRSLEYMHRFLLWNGLQEFLLHVMPAINLERVKTVVMQKFGMKTSALGCGFCGQALPLTLPVSADCGHVFCYYCAALEMQENPTPKCIRCNEVITAINPHY
eukprot:GEMP01063642.1.p1 GENE.GEMP01063642.1~~GEMP01063642.1.p1  ORF type:complete len:289 (+),score=61.88 GEMP01063642.1:94-960(+)